MSLRILYDEHSGALSYLLADEAAREAALVDPRSGDRPVLMALLDEAGLRLRWVLRTHDHDGHDDQPPGELDRLLRLGAPVVQGAWCEGARNVADGERLPLGAGFVQVLRTPGHTAHCQSYLWQDRMFCGDLLTADACPWQPRPALPAALWDSVQQRIFTLPDETLLFAGHERRARAVTTVLEQRRWSPHFAGLTRDGFFARVGPKPLHRRT
jgi:glyoxylase-like metal-dependent hydrolase (beta-lactamase superfamily II)